MVSIYTLVYTKQARKDAGLVEAAGLKAKVQELLQFLEKNPFHRPPPYEKLIGDLSGSYSRRINIKHRLVYQVFEEEKIIKIIRLWSHYE
jgi:toxin YoeB